MSDAQPFLSEVIADLCLEGVFQSVWKGVAVGNLKKMAPRSTFIDSDHTVRSFVGMSFTQEYKKPKVNIDIDPRPAPMDNFGSGGIDCQKDKSRSPKEKKKTQFSSMTEKSISKYQRSSSRLVTNEKTQKKQIPCVQLGAVEQNQEPKFVQKYRGYMETEQKNKKNHEKYVKEKKKQNQQAEKARQKLIKENKTITFTYDGGIQNINSLKLPMAPVNRMREKFKNASSNQKGSYNTIEPMTIESSKQMLAERKSIKPDRIVMREQEMFLTDAFKDQDKITAGVKITEFKNKNQTIVKEKPSKKLTGIKKYRLKQYKEYSKDKSFKEFSHLSKTITSDLSNVEIEAFKQKPNKMNSTEVPKVKANSFSETVLKPNQTTQALQNAMGRGLPFIRTKGYRLYDLPSTRSIKNTEISFFSNKKTQSNLSRIMVKDSELFEENFTRK